MANDIDWSNIKQDFFKDNTQFKREDIDWGKFRPPGQEYRPLKQDQIDPDSQYVEGEGILGSALDALDYAGNVSRSAIKGISEGGFSTAVQYAKEAIAKERRTSATEVKDIATEALGLGKLRVGDDDNEFQWGDVVDFGADLFVDVLTDPLSMASLGVSSILKGGKVAKALGKTGKQATRGKTELEAFKAGALPKMTDAAEKVAKFETGATAGLGALYGYGMSDKDDSALERIRNAALGAGVAIGGKKALPEVGKMAGSLGDALTDAYMRGTRGDKFTKFSPYRNSAVRSAEKIENVSRAIMQRRFEAIEGLEPAEKLKVFELMNEFKTATLLGRNAKAAERRVRDAKKMFGEESDQYLKAVEARDAVYEMNKMRTRHGKDSDKYLEAMSRVDDLTYETLDPLVDAALTRENKAISNSIKSWVKNNEDTVAELNKLTDQRIVPMKYHIDDIYDPKDYTDSKKLLESLKTVREGFDNRAIETGRNSVKTAYKLERSTQADDLAQAMYDSIVKEAKESPKIHWLKKQTGNQYSLQDPELMTKLKLKAHDELYGVYANKFARSFLNKQEEKAVSMMEDWLKTKPKAEAIKNFEWALGKFDKMNSFLKSNLLHFSTSWLVNNYWDNLTKSYVENGLSGVIGDAQLGLLQKGLRKDIKNIYSNKLTKLDNDEVKTALEYGALEGPAFRALVNENTEKYMNIKSIADELKKETPLLKGLDVRFEMGKSTPEVAAEKMGELANLWQSGLDQTVGNLGSYMEGYSRMMTFKRIKDTLKKQDLGMTEDAMNRIAANMTKKTFFDYADVSYFEKAVFKRLIPFYSFYSKNLPYWMSATFDPSKVGKIVNLEKVRQSVGEDPTDRQQKGMTDYILHASPRFIRRGKGETVYGMAPALSFHDAIKMIDPKGLSAQVIEKSNPYFKLPYELVTGNDLFTGDKLYPSDTLKGQKYLFSRGFKWYIAQEALARVGETMGMKNTANWLGVDVDSKGNPVSLADANIVVDKIIATFFPMGAVDQLLGSAGKVYYDKETFNEAIANRMLPIKTVKQSDAYANMIRGKRTREENKEKRFKARQKAYREKREKEQ